MDAFFEKRRIVVELQNGEKAELYMRPLLIRELPLTERVVELQEGGVDESEYWPLLIQLVENAVSDKLDILPASTLRDLVDVFLELNFGEEKKGKTKKKKALPCPSQLARVFDFLISQGHRYKDILDYTLPQVQLLQQAAVERLTGVKRVDPVEALTKAGVKVKTK